MKNHEVLEFGTALAELRKDLPGRVFSHAVVLNRKSIAPFVEALQEAREPSEEYLEFDQKFEELKKEHANKDGQGNPIIKTGIHPQSNKELMFYDVPSVNDPESEFSKKALALREEYMEHLKANEKMIEEWACARVDEDSEFKPIQIDLKDMPDEINHIEMEDLIYMVR